jgi:hypothetical protein
MDAVYSSRANAAAKMMKRISKGWGFLRSLSERESCRHLEKEESRYLQERHRTNTTNKKVKFRNSRIAR